MSSPLTISSWPRAILHIDADAFFASCEQAIHPEQGEQGTGVHVRATAVR